MLYVCLWMGSRIWAVGSYNSAGLSHWTVGFYTSDGEWIPDSDWDSPEEAVERMRVLNESNLDKMEEIDKR